MTFQQRITQAFDEEATRRMSAGERRLTKTDVWKAADATSGAATHWFNGSNGMDMATCIKVAPVLKVAAQWLYDGKGPKQGLNQEKPPDQPKLSALSQWPFPYVSETQVHALSETQRHMLGDVIAQAIAQLALGIDISANTWPFSSLTPEQWSMLTERQRGRAEGYIQSFVQEAEALAVKSAAKAKAA